MLNIRISAPRHPSRWDTYRVSEEDDLKRAAIANLAYEEGTLSLSALCSAAMTIIAFLLLNTSKTPGDTEGLGVWFYVGFFSAVLTIYFVASFLYVHNRRMKIIASLSSEARLQIRSVIGFFVDDDTFIFYRAGVSIQRKFK
jgi:hypothetical protein